MGIFPIKATCPNGSKKPPRTLFQDNNVRWLIPVYVLDFEECIVFSLSFSVLLNGCLLSKQTLGLQPFGSWLISGIWILKRIS